jgi:nitronate monooxygenase
MGNTARVFANAVANEVIATERRPGGCAFEDVRALVSGARGKAALESGEVDAGPVWAGQVIGLIDDVPTCAALLERMVAECRQQLARAAAFF